MRIAPFCDPLHVSALKWLGAVTLVGCAMRVEPSDATPTARDAVALNAQSDVTDVPHPPLDRSPLDAPELPAAHDVVAVSAHDVPSARDGTEPSDEPPGIDATDAPHDATARIDIPRNPLTVICEAAPLVDPTGPLSFSEPVPFTACSRTRSLVRMARVQVPAGRRVVIEAQYPASLAHVDSCERLSCDGGGYRRLIWENRSRETATTVVILDTPNETANVRAWLEVPNPHGSCDAPTPLAAGDTVRIIGVDAQGTTYPACMRTERVPMAYYATEVPAGMRLGVRAYPWIEDNPLVRRYPVQSYITTSCSPTLCPTWAELNDSLFMNDSAVTQRVLVGVRVGDYLVLETALERPATNGLCANAPLVSPGTILRNQRSVDGRDRPPAGCGGACPALHYRVRVGPHRRLAVSPGMINSTRYIHVRDGCEGACLPTTRQWRGDDTYTFWDNTSDVAREVVVMFFGCDVWPGQTVDLSFAEEPL
jgi:hypothetical protein